MRDLSIRDLLDLIAADVPDAEAKIEKIFDWHFERVKITSQWILGAAATLFISVLVSFFKGELHLIWWQTILITISALGSATYGVYRLFQLRSLHRQFVVALKLYCEFKTMRSFLIRYREDSMRARSE